MADIDAIRGRALSGLAEAVSSEALDAWRIDYLGRQGAVTMLLMMTAGTTIDLVPLYLYGTPESLTIFSGYIGFVLLGMACSVQIGRASCRERV